MWIYLSGSDGLPSIERYDYQPGQGGKYARSFLEGFSGLFQCDGYQGYNKAEDVILVCCFARCRRKFYEAAPAERRKKMRLLDIQPDGEIQEPVIPEEAELPKLIPAEVGLAYCNKLFFIERELKGLPADERKKRLEKETPVWEGFLFLRGSIHCVRNHAGFFAQSPDVIIKCADRDPVFYAPLAVGKSTGSALSDQF